MEKKKNILLIVLAISILANIALLASPQKRAPARSGQQPAIWSVNKGQLENIMRGLPDARRKELRDQLGKDFDQLRSITGNMFSERDKLSGLLAQPQLDMEAVEAQLIAIRGAQNASSEQAQKLILAILSKLTPEERMAALSGRKAPEERKEPRKGGKPEQTPIPKKP